MKVYSKLCMILLVISTVFIFSQCDSSNKINGPNGENSSANYTITLTIEPTAVYKTAGMRNVWDKTVIADFETFLDDDSHNEEMPMGNHHAHEEAAENNLDHESQMGHYFDTSGYVGYIVINN